MEKFDRAQYNRDKQKNQRDACKRLDAMEADIQGLRAAVRELNDICNTQQDDIDKLQATALAYAQLKEDYDALEAKAAKQAALIEELQARLGID